MATQKYNHAEIEQKWQRIWAEKDAFKAPKSPSKKKSYVLDMFPYPSGEGLHVGHPKGYIATDIYSRMKMAQGYDVLHPMGWDAFGLPAENFAIKHKVHPRVAVEKNIARFKEQLAKIGFTYDWSREINTTDPAYYKWTQWIFLQLYKKGLAYQSYEPINWCPSCQTGLANEDLEQGKCERCGSEVEKRPMRQWTLKITEYADRMLQDLDTLEWPESIKEAQRNWIGRKEGAEIDFSLKFANSQEAGERLTVFTTRPDTLFGATYLVVSPEHPWVRLAIDDKHASLLQNQDEVRKYVNIAARKTEIERTDAKKEKTGVELKGVMAIHPATGKEIPVWVADYVLADYGTGAIMAVPAHDERDFEFAENYNLPKLCVIDPVTLATGESLPDAAEKTSQRTKRILAAEEVYGGEGFLTNSSEFDGLASAKARDSITEKYGRKKVTYKLREWVFSRQRYWGEPIPIIHCEKDGVVPVPEEQLPVQLPEVEHYEPTGTGESPLAAIEDWVNVQCPVCNGPAKRETNTMPQWAGSSWYYLRFMDPNNDAALVDSDIEKAWAPVDVYVGGDHAVRHLIYARFWHKFLYDIGVVSTIEPFARLEFLGFILAEDGRKMSKRYGNVINPDDVVSQVGADAFRLYEMFMGPFTQTVSWSTTGIQGPYRFVERVWRLGMNVENGADTQDSDALVSALHKTIKRVSEDTEGFRFNTAVAALMEFLNDMEREKTVSRKTFGIFLQLLAPYAPHVAEELWEHVGNTSLICHEAWPEFDEAQTKQVSTSIVVQVNGKVRGEIVVDTDASQGEVETMARAVENVSKYLEAGQVRKVIYVPNRLINFVCS